jgi:hypothetical protein
MGEGRLVKKIYRESKRDHDDDAKVINWCSHTHGLLRTVGLADRWNDTQSVLDAGTWAKLVGEKVAAWEVKNWREEVNNDKVLDVYAQMKVDFKRESYLSGHGDPTGRMWLTRLRSGRHGLAVNTGRFLRPMPPRDQRWCQWCVKWGSTWVVEDERHVVLECPRYESERLEMRGELGLDDCDGESLEDLDRLIGKGPLEETYEERVKRYTQVKRFARRVLRKRTATDEQET